MQLVQISSQLSEQGLQAFIDSAEKTNNALVIKESEEYFARRYTSSIIDKYSCNGILVKQSHGGVAYTTMTRDEFELFEHRGFKPVLAQKEGPTTFGKGLVQAYPTPLPYRYLKDDQLLLVIQFLAGTLRSVYTVAKYEEFQGELCIAPELITDIAVVEKGEIM